MGEFYEFYKTISIDRTEWTKGPWDNEPDFYEWTTKVGYNAYLFRLPKGTWAAHIIAPYIIEIKAKLDFAWYLKDKRRDTLEYQYGMISKTDQEGIGAYGLSWEHWNSPISNPKARGPYKDMAECKAIVEITAQDIFEAHQTKLYENYLQLR